MKPCGVSGLKPMRVKTWGHMGLEILGAWTLHLGEVRHPWAYLEELDFAFFGRGISECGAHWWVDGVKGSSVSDIFLYSCRSPPL
jgi:hypothetical protein